MAKLRINGDSSGYVDLEAPNAASSSTLDLDQVPQKNVANTFTTGQNITVPTNGGLTIQAGTNGSASLRLKNDATDWDVNCQTTDNFAIYNHTTGGNRLGITPAGIVTTPSQPSFWATVSNDYTGYNSTDYSSGLIFNTALYNIGGHYSTSTGRFTAPVTGTYLLTAECYTTGQVWDQSWFTLNGSRPNGTDHVQNGQNIVGNTSMIKLNANDWVMFHPYSGNTNNLIKAAPQHTWFKGILLG